MFAENINQLDEPDWGKLDQRIIDLIQAGVNLDNIDLRAVSCWRSYE